VREIIWHSHLLNGKRPCVGFLSLLIRRDGLASVVLPVPRLGNKDDLERPWFQALLPGIRLLQGHSPHPTPGTRSGSGQVLPMSSDDGRKHDIRSIRCHRFCLKSLVSYSINQQQEKFQLSRAATRIT